MKKIRYLLVVLGMLLCSVTSSAVQVGIGFGLPHVNIGINFSAYPELVVVPGYPVYYAPRLEANLFFYDGMYWVYQDDYWYASSWFNGPWWLVEPEYVPVFILRIPVRYYLRPPVYFHGWRRDAPPRWGDHWGHDWDQHRSGWDRWDRRSAPRPAPPPVYQRQYSGDRYPQQLEQQHELHQRNYNYQPQDPVVRQHYQEQAAPRAPEVDSRQHDIQRSESPQRQGEGAQRSVPSSPQQGRPEIQDQRRQPQPGSDQRGQQMPRAADQQNTPRQQDVPAATREQSPQKGGMSIQRSNPPSSQQERTEGQSRKQQPKQGSNRQEQQRARSQEMGGQQDRGRNRDE